MTEIPQDAEDQIDAAAQAVALVVAQLIADVMAGKKRISVVSSPEWFVRPSVGEDPASTGTQLIGYRHTIEVEDIGIPDCADPEGLRLTPPA